MDQLAPELVDHLCLFLDIPSLCSFRLTCRAFAVIAEEHLFRDFEFRLYPNHHRLYQLEQLAARPSIASRLRCVSLESGIQLEYADYRYWQTGVYHDKKNAWERSLVGATRDEYTQFHERLQARFTTDLARRYDLYRWHLDQQAASMAESRVRNVLMRIMGTLKQSSPSLRLQLIMAEPQILLEELEAFDPEKYANDKPYDPDPRRRVANRRQHCLDHFINFLQAAKLSGCEVADLTAIDIPQQLLTVDTIHGSQVLEETFQGLKRLCMKISSFPHSDWLSRSGTGEIYFGGRNLAARRLRMLLNHPSELEHLDLEFPPGLEAEYSFDLFDRTNIDRFPRLWLPHLKSLTLSLFRCTWADLAALLDEGKNLKSLAMKDCRLETGSLIDLLEHLRRRRLPRVQLLGTWYVDEDCGEWHSHSEEDFTSCFAANSYEGPYARAGVTQPYAGKSCCVSNSTVDTNHAVPSTYTCAAEELVENETLNRPTHALIGQSLSGEESGNIYRPEQLRYPIFEVKLGTYRINYLSKPMGQEEMRRTMTLLKFCVFLYYLGLAGLVVYLSLLLQSLL
ncbi:uncharacterized protein Z520_04943 [Fonsecaea multimorphosa CBS 102226]|uniref:F-box domain-containing protein n=1 Tax=Fonsecaea multimorphosa CBS 102226 TaxID=1442371 RepID=A0A0D2K0P8_9EURO|nr:uncharacterized protein Z520_04943 [Fonsecaea multimorphosa CBS 102226]KIX99367.1 hypothetical protein Z520_04943 [Fonsecaea multimorphosa CBS 102226]